MSWNVMFHTILDECHLTSYFDMDTLPKNYLPGRVCGQSLQVDLDHVRYNTMHLTLLELINNKNDNQREYIDFIDAVLFTNPIWDLGLQHKLMEKNNQKIYQGNITNYTQQCICPCSSIFKAQHQQIGITKYQQFRQCQGIIYDNPISFFEHIHKTHHEIFHKIILRIIQGSYSILRNKIKFESEYKRTNMKRFYEICKDNIQLPKYTNSRSNYSTVKIKRYEFFHKFNVLFTIRSLTYFVSIQYQKTNGNIINYDKSL